MRDNKDPWTSWAFFSFTLICSWSFVKGKERALLCWSGICTKKLLFITTSHRIAILAKTLCFYRTQCGNKEHRVKVFRCFDIFYLLFAICYLLFAIWYFGILAFSLFLTNTKPILELFPVLLNALQSRIEMAVLASESISTLSQSRNTSAQKPRRTLLPFCFWPPLLATLNHNIPWLWWHCRPSGRGSIQ